MRAFAKAVSVLFHPLLFPLYGSALILAVNPNLYGYFGEKVHFLWLIIVFILTCLFPAIWLVMMKRLEMIDNLQLDTANERIIPFIATATFYLMATWMFKPSVTMKVPSNLLIFYMMMGGTVAIFVSFFINIFSKISLHAVGGGSLIGLGMLMIRFSTYDLRIVFIALILLAGLIGTARLVLEKHTPLQVFTGYLVGFTGQFVAFSIISRFV
ncbi:MAG: phosphatase PAP2 family protein [Bacteroidetes bacterium]|nr:phosphatase PAP2 family protein [Bacteroidota bacterium]